MTKHKALFIRICGHMMALMGTALTKGNPFAGSAGEIAGEFVCHHAVEMYTRHRKRRWRGEIVEEVNKGERPSPPNKYRQFLLPTKIAAFQQRPRLLIDKQLLNEGHRLKLQFRSEQTERLRDRWQKLAAIRQPRDYKHVICA